MDKNLYSYKAKLIKVIDGDTIDIEIDLGFDVHINQRLRLYNVDAPETRTKNLLEKEAGLHVKFLVEVILTNKELYVKTIKTSDKFGRYLADVYFNKVDDSGMASLSEYLISRKFVKEYDGTTQKEEWTDEELNHILK